MSNEIVMEANELQICDYVNYRGRIIKVTSLYDKGGSNEVGWSDKEGVWVNADNVKPIPLTPEIMEKIGWINTAPGVWQQEFGDVAFYWDEDTHWGGLDVFRHQCDNMQLRIKIESFHQLQHALRLCGIKKELTITEDKK